MRGASLVAVGILLLFVTGCEALAPDWPDRRNQSPEQMLVDLVRWQQHKHVRASTGILAFECFTDDDYRAFVSEKRPASIVERLRKASDFAEIVTALRTLPRERLLAELRAARRIARPTWAQMGFIDRQGRGQTEAGQAAELLIAGAIVGALAVDLGIDLALLDK